MGWFGNGDDETTFDHLPGLDSIKQLFSKHVTASDTTTSIDDGDDDSDGEAIHQEFIDEIYLEEQQALEEAYADMDHKPSHSMEVADISDEEAELQAQLGQVEDLRRSIKDRAIKIAHDILDNLRVLFADVPVSQLLDMADTEANHPILQQLFTDIHKVGDTFRHHLHVASRFDPDLLEDLQVLEAQQALGMFSYQSIMNEITQAHMQMIELEAAGQDVSAMREHVTALQQEADSMPEAWKSSDRVTVSELLDTIESGLDCVVNRMQDLTQSQNQLGMANELMLSKHHAAPTLGKPGHAKDETHDMDEQDKKFDAAMAVRQAVKERNARNKEVLDRKTGKDTDDQAMRSRSARKKMTVGDAMRKTQRAQAKAMQVEAQQNRQEAVTARAKANAMEDAMRAAANAVSFGLDDITGDGDALKPFSAKDMAKQIAKKGVQADRAADAARNTRQSQQQEAQEEAQKAAQRHNQQQRTR